MIDINQFTEFCRSMENDLFGIIGFIMLLIVLAIGLEAIFQIWKIRSLYSD